MNLKGATALLGVALTGAMSTIAAAAPESRAAVAYRGTGWVWSNPLPQGDSIDFVHLAGGRGYAHSGQLLRTDDGGETWVELDVDEFGLGEFRQLTVPDTETVLLSWYPRTVRRSDDGGLTFRSLPVPFRPGEEVGPVAFPSRNRGFVSAWDNARQSAEVLATDDGGETFSRRGAIPRIAERPVRPQELLFFDAEVGLLLGEKFAPNHRSVILRTTDGGQSWHHVATGSSPINDLTLLGGGEAFAVGGKGLVLRSFDRGATWEEGTLQGAPAGSLGSVACRDRNTCLVVGAESDLPFRGSGPLLRSTDGLRSVTPPLRTGGLRSAAFGSMSRAVAVGEGGLILLSTDDGARFSEVTRALPGSSHKLQAVSSTVVYGVSNTGALARSVDGGRSWLGSRLPIPRRRYVKGFSFPSSAVGFVLEGSFGRPAKGSSLLLRTTDGGESWRRVNAPASRRLLAVHAFDRRRLLVLGRRGKLLRSSDAGARLRPVRQRVVARASLFSFDTAEGALFAYGPGRVVRSPDGKRWTRVRAPVRGPFQLDFVSLRRGFAVSRHLLFATRDGGRRWRLVRSIGGNSVYQVSFGDRRHGFADVSYQPYSGTGENNSFGGARLLVTSNGGKTWRLQGLNDEEGPVYDVLALGGSVGIVDLGGPLLWTGKGGDPPRRSRISLAISRTRGRPGVVTVRGSISPARPDRVQLSRWTGRKRTMNLVTVGPGGGFRSRVRAKRSSFIVAHVESSSAFGGAGTRAIKVP